MNNNQQRDDAKLCYISGGHDYDKDEPNEWIAFFTTKELSEQWGDDWNDSPYEHNAGWPYLPHKHYKGYDREKKEWYDGSDYENGIPKWRIYQVTFTTDKYLLPCAYSVHQCYDGHGLAVDQINGLEAAWLWPSRYGYMDAIRALMAGEKLDPTPIFAGETLAGFCEKVARNGNIIKVEEYAREA